MKLPSKIFCIAALCAAMAAVFVPRDGRSQQAPAAQTAPAAANEQYRVLDLSNYNNVSQLETDLNKMGAQGWKVRTSVRAFVILGRPE